MSQHQLNQIESIDWAETNKLGITKQNIKSTSKIVAICKFCSNRGTVPFRSLYRQRKRKVKLEPYEWICRSCGVKIRNADPERLRKFQESFAKTASNPEYRKKCSKNAKIPWKKEGFREKISKAVSEDNKINPKKIEGRKKALKAFMETDYKKHLDRIRIISQASLRERCQSDPEFRIHLSKNFLNYYNNPYNRSAWLRKIQSLEHRKKCMDIYVSKEYRQKQSELSLALWLNPDYREKTLAAQQTEEHRKLKSEIAKKLWTTKEYRDKQMTVRRSLEYREKMARILANMPTVSSNQKLLYSLLKDLGIPHYREYNNRPNDQETIFGPYTIDCVIPRLKDRDLLIEVNGDWIHTQEDRIIRDKQKATYLTNYFPDHELKYLWEHEFECKDKIINLIQFWTGTEYQIMDFDFNNVKIKISPASDYRLLLSKYHYLCNAGRGGRSYGAYYNQQLIAVCVFSPLPRQNIAEPTLGLPNKEVRELSRFCIHPKYQKKNFGSWFMSRCLKQLKKDCPKYKKAVSYCDTTFDHDGALYKATNFVQDRTVPPDYWYVDEDGWVMKKRTLYGKAVNLKMTEAEFARTKGYTKVYGKEKLRFVYDLR